MNQGPRSNRRSRIAHTSGTANLCLSVLCLCLSLLSSCSRAVQEPEVRLDRVSVGALGLEGGVLRVRLQIVNPNRFGIQADGLEYLIEVARAGDGDEWSPLTEGRFTDAIAVEGNDSALVEIPVRFQYRDLGSAVRAALASGAFDYRVSGRVRLTEPLRREIPFRRDGTVELF